MNLAVKLVFLSYPIGLLLLFVINVFYFAIKKQTIADRVFEFKRSDYTYQLLTSRLKILKEFLGNDINYAFKRAEYYYLNSKKTRRKFLHYHDLIERSIVLIYAKKGEEAPVTYLFKNLTPIFRFEVMFTMLFFPILLVFGLFFHEIENEIVRLGVFLLSTTICYVSWFQFTRLYIGIKYEILVYIFIIFKLPTGKIRRNINSLTYLFHTSYFHRPLYALLTFAGLAALAGGIKPKGFGGGSFGGGGAGGSW